MHGTVRQTQTHISELLAQHGLAPRHSLGQNFLVDLNLIEFLVNAAGVGPDDVVLEVGSGTGGLTTLLAARAARVIAVEVDPAMQRLTAQAAKGLTNVTLVGGDVLKNKNRLAPPVLDALGSALADKALRLKLVANLPYGVATPVIANLIGSPFAWDRMAVTIQLELARRMTAPPRTEDYGALSAWVQSQCRIEVLKRLPPDVFWPRPNVESAMIRLEPDATRAAKIADRLFLHDFLRDVFGQRRKLLRNVLSARYGDRLGRAEVDAVLKSQNLGERVRAEELSPEALVELCRATGEAIRQSRGEDSPSSKPTAT